jgi:hypothetical protein
VGFDSLQERAVTRVGHSIPQADVIVSAADEQKPEEATETGTVKRRLPSCQPVNASVRWNVEASFLRRNGEGMLPGFAIGFVLCIPVNMQTAVEFSGTIRG